MKKVRFAASALAALLAPRAAEAHGEIGTLGSFYTGLLHPFLIPSHLLAMTAVALLIGQAPGMAAGLALATYLLAYAVALALTLVFGAGAVPIWVFLAIAAVAGLLVVTNVPALGVMTQPIAGMSGALIGIDSAPDGATLKSRLLLAGGTLLTGAFAVMAVAVLTHGLRHEWQRVGVRVAGSWVAASAILVLALAFARA